MHCTIASSTSLHDTQMSGSVSRSKRALEEIHESGANILVNMAGSRERLKVRLFCMMSIDLGSSSDGVLGTGCCTQKAHRKVLDVINSVGLGETLLKLIERRHRMDVWIAYGGMLVVLVVTGLLLWWAWS